MKVLVCGSRSWGNWQAIKERLSQLPRGTTIIHGDARGADKMAATIARSLGFEVEAYPADWRAGRAAGVMRNLRMLDQQPDLVIAFWHGRSNGTGHTIDAARRRGIEVEVIAA